MRVYKNALIVTFALTIAAFYGAIMLNFIVKVDSFWANALLGVFGSSLLTFTTSVVGYRVERRKTFEGFWSETREMLKTLNKYQIGWTLEEKINFFLSYHDTSKVSWDRYFGDFSFLFNWKKKTSNYIYSNIYHPILEINNLISSHVWHFRWYKDGSGQNDVVVGGFVQEIEELIMETTQSDFKDPEGNSHSTNYTKNKIVNLVRNELEGKYYILMYGKRLYNKNKQKTIQ